MEESLHIDVIAVDKSIYCKMPENPAFICDLNSNQAARQDSGATESDPIPTNIREKDDIRHSMEDTASLLMILSQTSSRLTKSLYNVSKNLKSPAITSGRTKEWPKEKLRDNKCLTRYLGLILAFISGVMMTTYSSMIKMLETMDSMQVVVIRGSLQFFIMGSIAIYKNVPFKGNW